MIKDVTIIQMQANVQLVGLIKDIRRHLARKISHYSHSSLAFNMACVCYEFLKLSSLLTL